MLLAGNLVVEAELLGPNLIEENAADGCLDDGKFAVTVDCLHTTVGICKADTGVDLDATLGEGHLDAVFVNKERLTQLCSCLCILLGHDAWILRDVVAPERNILRRVSNGLAAGRREDVVRGKHQGTCLKLCLNRKRDVDRHLVTIEVGVVSRANERVDADSLTLNEDRLEGLDRETVKGWRAVEENGVALGHLFKDIPNLGGLALDELLGTAHGVYVAELLETANNEWLEQNKRHLLWKTALVELELGSDDDNGTSGVINALAEEILTEAAALALEHVAEGLERTVAGTGDGTAVTAVVIEGVDSLLEHALLVADDNLRGLELE